MDNQTEAVTRMRVEVWNGTGETYLGKGYFVGLVDVYAIHTGPFGYILSEEDPTKEPSEENLKWAEENGGEYSLIKLNPKLKMDDGRIIYGCQCWWQPIPEEEDNNE